MERDTLHTLPTIDSAPAQLYEMTSRLDIMERELQEARQAYETARQAPHADLEDVRDRIEATQGAALRRAERETADIAQATRERARAMSDAFAEPPLVLSGGERVEAAAMQGFVKDECESAKLPALATAVRGAIVSGDKAAMFAYASYLPTRLRPAAGSGEPGSGPDRDSADKRELRELLDTIRDRLRDARYEPLRREALDVASRAGAAERDAERRRRAEHLANRPYVFQTAQDVSWDRGEE